MKRMFAKGFVCLVLGLGSMTGVVMRPEEIEELMSAMNKPKVAHTIPEEQDNNDPIKKLLKEMMHPSRQQ